MSSPDGGFAFQDLRPGTYLVSATKPGYATINVTVSVGAGESQSTSFTLENADQTTLRQIGRVAVARNSTTQLNTTAAATNTIASQTYVQRGQAQVSNVLEELPGVELQRFSSGGSPGANTVAALRGADPSETQTLIDGHPVSGGPQGNYLIQFLNPLILSDIEVTKGPGTISNQIQNQVNGSINYRTLPIYSDFNARLTSQYDTFYGSTASLFASDTIGKVGFAAAYARNGTPGYFSGNILSVAANGTPLPGTIPDATATLNIPSTQTFDNRAELVKLRYDFSNTTGVTLSYFGLHTYADYTSSLTTLEPFHIVGSCPKPSNPNTPTGPGTGNGCGAFDGSNSGATSYTNPALANLIGSTVYASSTNDNLYLGNYETDNEPFFSADLHTTLGPGSFLGRFYAASIARDINGPEQVRQPYQCDDAACSPAAIQNAQDYQGAFFQTQSDYLHGADFSYGVPVGPNTYTASYDTHGDRTSSCNGGTPSPTNCNVPSVLQTSETIAARGDLHFGSKIGAQLGNYFSHTTFVGSRYDPHVGITFTPNANVILRAAAGSSFVAPSAQTAYNGLPQVRRGQLYLTLGAAVPETDVSYNLGTDIRTSTDAKLAVDVFATRLFNRFNSTTLTGPGAVGSFQGSRYTKINETFNQSSALEEGIELTYLKAPRYGFGTTDYLDFQRAYAGNSNPLFAPAGSIYGNVADFEQFPGYPFTHGRVELNYLTKNQIRTAFGADYYGALNSFNEPGFVQFDANAQFKLKAGFVASIAVQNVFNHDFYRSYGAYNLGTSSPALGGGIAYSTLYFAPPRQITFQLSRTIGNAPDLAVVPDTAGSPDSRH